MSPRESSSRSWTNSAADSPSPSNRPGQLLRFHVADHNNLLNKAAADAGLYGQVLEQLGHNAEWEALVSSTYAPDTPEEQRQVHDAWSGRRFVVVRRTTRPQVSDPPVTVHVFEADTFELQRELVEVAPGEHAPVDDPARSVVDARRLRHQVGADIADGALRRLLAGRRSAVGDVLYVARALDGEGSRTVRGLRRLERRSRRVPPTRRAARPRHAVVGSRDAAGGPDWAAWLRPRRCRGHDVGSPAQPPLDGFFERDHVKVAAFLGDLSDDFAKLVAVS